MVNPESSEHDLALDSFSAKLGPVFVKELRQGLRAHRFVAPFLGIHVLAILLVAFQFFVAYFADQNAAPSAIGINSFFNGMLENALVLLLWLIVGVIMPLTGINALQPELSGGRNVELLLMAGLTRFQIMRGKWLVLCSLSGLIMISTLPYMLTLYFTGGVELVEQMIQFASIVIFNIIMSAVVVGASGFSNILSRLIVIGIAFFSFQISSLIALAPGFASGTITWTSFLALLNFILVGTLYSLYGLHLGRDRLRLFSNPIEPPSSGLIIGMIIFTPLAIAVPLIISPIGSLVSLVGLIFLSQTIDPQSGQGASAAGIQP